MIATVICDQPGDNPPTEQLKHREEDREMPSETSNQQEYQPCLCFFVMTLSLCCLTLTMNIRDSVDLRYGGATDLRNEVKIIQSSDDDGVSEALYRKWI